MALIGAWAISGIFATAFQCSLPSPWRITPTNSCISIRAISIYNDTLNILTDLVIYILPITMIWNVHTNTSRKLQVCALFGSRILVPAITIPALVTSTTHFTHLYTDPTWHIVLPTILTQISLNLSVLTACIPGLKSILDNLLSRTANARVRSAYNLTSSSDKKARLTVTPWNASAGSNSKHSADSTNMKVTSKSRTNASNSASGSRSLHNKSGSNYTFLTSGGVGLGDAAAVMSGARQNRSMDESESQKRLSEGVIYCTDGYEVSSIQNFSKIAERGDGAMCYWEGRMSSF